MMDQEELRRWKEKNTKARASKMALEDRREEWVKKHLQAGDVITVIGTSRTKFRLVEKIKPHSIECRQIRPATIWHMRNDEAMADALEIEGIMWIKMPQITEHMHNKVTAVLREGQFAKI